MIPLLAAGLQAGLLESGPWEAGMASHHKELVQLATRGEGPELRTLPQHCLGLSVGLQWAK